MSDSPRPQEEPSAVPREGASQNAALLVLQLRTEIQAMAVADKLATTVTRATLDRWADWIESLIGEPEPGQMIAEFGCPLCGGHLEVSHGDDEGEISVIGTPRERTSTAVPQSGEPVSDARRALVLDTLYRAAERDARELADDYETIAAAYQAEALRAEEWRSAALQARRDIQAIEDETAAGNPPLLAGGRFAEWTSPANTMRMIDRMVEAERTHTAPSSAERPGYRWDEAVGWVPGDDDGIVFPEGEKRAGVGVLVGKFERPPMSLPGAAPADLTEREREIKKALRTIEDEADWIGGDVKTFAIGDAVREIKAAVVGLRALLRQPAPVVDLDACAREIERRPTMNGPALREILRRHLEGER